MRITKSKTYLAIPMVFCLFWAFSVPNNRFIESTAHIVGIFQDSNPYILFTSRHEAAGCEMYIIYRSTEHLGNKHQAHIKHYKKT